MTTESAPPPPLPPTRRRRWRLVLALTVLPLGALAALAIGTTWLLKNENGSAWLLRQLPGLQVEAPRGPLLGDFAARRVLLDLPGKGGRITIDGLQWQGLTVAWSQSPQLWGRIAMDRLHVDSVDVALAPSRDTSPLKPPTSLAVPLGLKVGVLELGALQLSALPGRPFTGLRGSVDLSGEEGAQHRVKIDALQWEQLRLAGQARIATGGRMEVEAALVLQPGQVDPSLPDWRGGLTITGPLADLQIQAKSEAAGQALQAQARLQAFAKWPLAGFSAQVAALDLSALMKDLPKTALSGDVRLDSQGWSEPAKVQLQLSNAAAGRWDQQRLPVQKLSLALQARPDQPRSLRLESLDAQLGSAKAPAGRITGEGTLQPDQRWTLTARLDGVRPEALDQRAAPMLLGGRVDLAGATDLAAPLTLTARLSGRIPAAPPLAIDAAARLEGRHLRIEQARIESGSSKLVLSGQAQLEDAGWRAEAKTALKDFDPRLFVAGAPGSAWRRGATALNAEGSLSLQRDAASGPLPRGQATLQLLPSKLMGLPIGGKLEYNAAGKADASLSAQLDAGENHLLAITQLGTLPQLATQLELQAPKLADAAPLIELLSGARIGAGAAEGKAGLQLQKTADGQWLPAGDGVVNLRDLRITAPNTTTLKEARLRWSFGSKPDSALALNLQIERLGSAGQEIKQASVDLQGTWARHSLKFAAQAQPSRGPVADLSVNLDGILSGSPLLALQDGKPLDWQARIAQLELKPKAEAPPPPAPQTATAPLLRAAGLDLRLQLGSGLAPAALQLQPGLLELSGARLRWSEISWQAALRQGTRPEVHAELQLEPLALAPLLARWQPDFGWGGNLVVAGRASVRSSPQLSVDAVLERSAGDLSVTDERGPQQLGLTDLRLGLTVRNGLWQLTEALAGTQMGALGGAVSIHADPAALWPAPASRIDGVLQANVARLGTWGAWVPAGWRLGGSLEAGMQIGGTVANPELRGHANGRQLSLRNPLLGVDVTDGVVDMSLDGSTVRLQSLSAKGGAGSVQASGEARLGQEATAKLQLKADRFVLLRRVDRRLSASGQAELDLAPKLLKLDGRFTVDEGLFDLTRGNAPTLDDDVIVTRASQPPPPAAPPKPAGEPRRTRIAVTLNLGNDLKVRGHGLDSRLRGEVKLTQVDDGGPQLNGTVSAVGGTYAAYGQKLEVERGDIAFAGPYDNPRLDVLAIRPDVDIRVGVAVTGTALSPRVKLFSDPDMAETDKLSWLLLGRAPDTLGRTDTALLQRAALALLSGEGESTSGKLIKNLGLDELSLGQSDDSTQGTIVRLGKQLSRRWYVGYERGLNATTGSWQLIYRIAQRFTLRAQTGEDNALDLIWQWKWE